MFFSTFSTENLMNLLSQSLVSSALQPPYFFLQSSQVNTSDRLMIVFETTPLFDNKTTKILKFSYTHLLDLWNNTSDETRHVVLETSKPFSTKIIATSFLCLFVVLENSKPVWNLIKQSLCLCLFVVPESSKPSNSIYLYIFYNLYSLSISMIITPCFNIYILRFTAWSQLTLFSDLKFFNCIITFVLSSAEYIPF